MCIVDVERELAAPDNQPRNGGARCSTFEMLPQPRELLFAEHELRWARFAVSPNGPSPRLFSGGQLGALPQRGRPYLVLRACSSSAMAALVSESFFLN